MYANSVVFPNLKESQHRNNIEKSASGPVVSAITRRCSASKTLSSRATWIMPQYYVKRFKASIAESLI